jgi:hypothetical protein
LINLVFPGVVEILASECHPVSILIRDDFPTLDLPRNAYSGLEGFGH